MKKYYIITSILILCILWEFYYFNNKISSLQEWTKVDTFQKKQECVELFLKEEKYLEEESTKSERRDFKIYYRPDYVFYSPVVNSCIMVFYETDYDSWEYTRYYWYKDLLTREEGLVDTKDIEDKNRMFLKIEGLK
jgi:hypothetical protein